MNIMGFMQINWKENISLIFTLK